MHIYIIIYIYIKICVGTTATHVSAGPPTTLHLFPPEASRGSFFQGIPMFNVCILWHINIEVLYQYIARPEWCVQFQIKYDKMRAKK